MAILVTGGTGYIGSHTVVELLNNGYDVVIVDNYVNSKPEVLNRIYKITGKNPRFYEVDVCNEEKMREVFLNMDIALKYIHDHNYCVEVFYPSEITVLENKPDHIQFNKLLELSSNPSIKNNMIKEDIFNSSLIIFICFIVN